MVEPQETPLPLDIEYSIDVLLDEMSIDSATANAMVLYGDRAIISGIMTQESASSDWHDNNRSIENVAISWRSARRHKETSAACLMEYATDLIERLPLDKQGALASAALTHMDYTTRRTAEFMANWAIGDKAEGGYGEHYNRPPRCQKNSVWPYKKDVRRLYSPAWIRRYVKREDECHRVQRIGSTIARRVAKLDPRVIAGGMEIFRAEWLLAEERRQAYEARQWEAIRAGTQEGLSPIEALEPRITLKKKWIAKLRKRHRKERKILKRGMATANLIVGEEKTRAFLKGEPVTLEGVNLDLIVTKRRRAVDLDHSQIGLAAAMKDGTKLADLCFYIEDTPAIDQLTAVALHAAAGEEQEIVNIANIINIAPAAMEHPSFSTKREVEAAIRVMAAADEQGLTRIENDAVYIPDLNQIHLPDTFRNNARMRDEKYWQDTKHIWLEATGVFLLGARYHKLMLQHASEQ